MMLPSSDVACMSLAEIVTELESRGANCLRPFTLLDNSPIIIQELAINPAPWSEVEEASDRQRQEGVYLDYARGVLQRVLDPNGVKLSSSSQGAKLVYPIIPEVKRRGRPRKHFPDPSIPKRPRGRPRKTTLDPLPTIHPQESQHDGL